MKLFIRSLVSLALAAVSAGAAPIPVQSFSKDADGVTLRMSPGVLKLQVCDADIIRVFYSPAAQVSPAKSFVITREWKPVSFKVRENPKEVTVSTARLRVVVNRATGALTFLDAAGKPLLMEAADGGKTLTPVTVGPERTHRVEQVFQCPADEVLYGLGQFQDGLWNWRGIPLELRQLNTQIAMPMMLSSKGYGLLWDNASLLDFNPADRQITLDGSTASAATGDQPKATEDLAKTPMDITKLGRKTGTFTTGAAGNYVFFAKDGNRRGDFAILIDGRQVAGVVNMWTPYALSAKVTLPANTTVTVGLRGGGDNAKLFARPLGDTTTFRSQMGEAIDYTFFYGPSVDEIVGGYRKATGAAPLWPKWAYGFWQCRERYSSQQQIVDAIAEFRQRQIPADLFVQDWQYWGPHGWGAYQWDLGAYPDPAQMLKNIHAQNAKFMISVWCNPRGKAGKELAQNRLLLGEWIDVFNPQGRELRWKHLNDAFFKIGTDAWWGDATEPADDGEGIAGRATSLGFGGRVRNSYPLFASQSLYEGQRASDPNKRVCTLTRSAYPGMQRYAAAAWSGDINGNWETFQRQIPAGLNFCLTGIPYWTTDCGGFFHPQDQYKNADYNELLTRWFQWSTFSPILRIHGYQTATEMWNWLPETQKIMLAYDQFRYRMLPYNYSVAWKVTSEGYTIMRALPMDFPNDPKVLAISDEYMFGPAFLVAPVTEPVSKSAGSRKVFLPAGADWVNFWTGEKYTGGREVVTPAPMETLPLYVRAGSIVPLGPVVQYATENPEAPYEIRIYPGADAKFTIYEDDNETYNYEKGQRATYDLVWNDAAKTLTVGARQGSFPGMVATRKLNVVLAAPGKNVGFAETRAEAKTVEYTGRTVKVKLGR